MRRWLASVDGVESEGLLVADVINASAELTKDALRVIAENAPGEMSQGEVVKALTNMGYKVTDASRDSAMAGLHAIESATGGSVIRNVSEAGKSALFEMNAQIAKQILKRL